jgi:multidrug resistance efflux pump
MARFFVYTFAVVTLVGAIALLDKHTLPFFKAGPSDIAGHSSDAPRKIYATGFVEGVTRTLDLWPEISGRVVEVAVRTNNLVEADDVLIRLDDRQQQQERAVRLASLELAIAQLDRLKNGPQEAERREARSIYEAQLARLDQATKSWRRIQELRRQLAVSQQEADDQRTTMEALAAEVKAAHARLEVIEAPARPDEIRAAQARVAAAKANLELSELLLQKTRLKAPFAATVLALNCEQGELVGPTYPVPVLSLADLSTIRIRAYVDEIDAPRLTVGMRATISADGLPARTYDGCVEELSPRMKPKEVSADKPNELYDTRVREVVVRVDKGDGLLVGLRVDVLFDCEE